MGPSSAAGEDTFFRDAFANAAIGIAQTTGEGRIVRVNARFCEILGYPADELVALSFIDITHPDDVARNTELFIEVLAGTRDGYRMEKRFLRKDGGTVWTSLAVTAQRSKPSGRFEYVIAYVDDISAQKAVEAELLALRATFEREVNLQTEALRERNEAMRLRTKQLLQAQRIQRDAERRFLTITNSIPAMIGYWNSELRCEFANAAYQEWFGVAPERVIGMRMQELIGAELFAENEPYARGALAGEPQRFARRLAKPDGTVGHTDATYLPDFDEFGEVRGFFVLVTDVTTLHETQLELEAANARLRHEAATDDLTGLANRRVFTERSVTAFAGYQRAGARFGLILLDIDAFKSINDSFGHHAGDDVLRAIGAIVPAFLRDPADLAARLGGDEFAILVFDEVDERSLVAIAERIRVAASAAVVTTLGGDVTFTSSIGLAISEPGDASFEEIYARADAALYEAKARGRDGVVFRGSLARAAGE